MKKEYIVATCKKTKKVFKDYKNSSGVLTEHIKKIYPDLIHPSNFIKRKYKIDTGKFWHEQYFDIKKIEKEIELKKCKFCNWETKDINNNSGQYTIHLLKHHNLDTEQYLKKFPEEKFLFKTFVDNKKNKEKMLSNKDNYVICKICDKKLKTLTNTHLKKHKIDLEKYKEMYPNEVYHSQSFIKRTSKNLKNATTKIKNSYISKPEISLKQFLTSLNIDFDNNNRKFLSGVEIDIINHTNKIGIEFNGNLYHTENYGGKLKNFHLNKTNLMNKKGYFLIHITEDEWELKNEIVKNKLKHIFQKSNLKNIHARSCQIKELNSIEKDIFLNKYHIQGEDKSNIKLGAFFNNELIAVMTFDNIRQMNGKNKNNDLFELKRFCVNFNYNVPGIFGKILKFFIKNYNPNKIISFADRRWTLNKENNLYTKTGFILTQILKPDYTYYNSKVSRFKRFHKFSFGKSSLKKKFPEIYDEKKTEWEMMQMLKYDRIWDCGKFKYELIL